MIAVAIMTSAIYVIWQAHRRHLYIWHMIATCVIASLSGLIGMRVFHILVEAPTYYLEHPSSVWNISNGGFVSWGAIIGLLVGTIAYLKIFKLSIRNYWDTLALGFPIIFFFVRIGCLGTGCCYGKPTDLPIYVVFTDISTPAAQIYPGIAIHAVQLYSIIHSIIMFILLVIIARKQTFRGQIVCSFLILYGIFRFIEELFRGDIARGVYFNFISTGIIMSCFAILFGIIGTIRFHSAN